MNTRGVIVASVRKKRMTGCSTNSGGSPWAQKIALASSAGSDQVSRRSMLLFNQIVKVGVDGLLRRGRLLRRSDQRVHLFLQAPDGRCRPSQHGIAIVLELVVIDNEGNER